MLEWIREKEPPRPSTRLSDSGDAITGISAQRRIEPSKLQQILRGDLDWIVMKAIEKDRTRRYETAIDFAEDLQRYVSGEAVHARPPSRAYKLKKFVRKNFGLVAAALAFVILMFTGTAFVGWFAVKAETLRKSESIARGIADTKSALAALEASRAKANETTARKESERARAAEQRMTAQLARSDYYLAKARWNEGRVADAIDHLDRIPEQHRRIEFYLDRRLYEGSYATLYGHQDNVKVVSFSPDGNHIASGAYDGTIKLWDAKAGNELRTLVIHDYSVTALAFSPNSQRVAWGDANGTLKILDLKSGEQVEAKSGHHDRVSHISFSPDGSKVASASWDESVKLWDSQLAKGIQTLSHKG